VRINSFLITNSQEGEEARNEALIAHHLELLKAMTFYATTSDCLRSRLLGYFGDAAPNYCGKCSNCDTVYESVDITIPAQKIVSCVYRLERMNRRFGKAMVINILRGSKNEKIRSFGLDSLSTYGIMADMDAHRVRIILDYLVDQRYLAVTGDEYPVVIQTERSREIIFDKKPLGMMLPREEKRSGPPDLPEDAAITALEAGRSADKKAAKAAALVPDSPAAGAEGLLTKLRELRARLAREARVPAYIVFSDAALRDMCRKLPETQDQFLDVSGVGARKMEKYGAAFIGVIREWKRIED
jgi:ATP-dependent DNA helicase RecQ